MKTVTQHLRDHLEKQVFKPILPELSILKRSEWCGEFEQLMRNRLIIGAFRYGLFNDPNKLSYQHLESIRRRLDSYEHDGNLEHLVDIANLCMVEYIKGKRNGFQVKAIDDGEHVRSE